MDKKLSLIFAALLVLLAVLNMTYGAPQSLTIWEVFGWLTGQTR